MILPSEMQETLRVWTVQPWAVWGQVEAQGVLTVDPRYSADLHLCYEWLRKQLLRRVPAYAGHYPWWAYCTRPDLRRIRHNRPRGKQYALIELDLPRDQVVVFPFWAWDRIFYQQFLSPNQWEAEDWERRLREAVPDEETHRLPEPWWTELTTSWEQLFDPGLPVRPWPPARWPPVSEQEAVFEFLDRRNVSRVTLFIGASNDVVPREPLFWHAHLGFEEAKLAPPAGSMKTPHPNAL